MGQGAKNYRVFSPDRTLFVKCYVHGTNLADEHEGIRLTKLAEKENIPTASIVPNKSGDWIDRHSRMPMSVWTWVDGSVETNHLNDRKCFALGQTLGVIHRLFSGIPESKLTPTLTKKWRQISVQELTHKASSFRTIIDEKRKQGLADSFDIAAETELFERERQLHTLPWLLEKLPNLTSQVIHGDYNPINLMFAKDQLAAVLDFRAPKPFLVAYELGRVSFYPNYILSNSNWISNAYKIVVAYIEGHPNANPLDVMHCGRVALIQLIKSFYGVKQHYYGSGLLQNELDTFWKARHKSAAVLLDNLNEVEDMLELAASSSATRRYSLCNRKSPSSAPRTA